MEELHESNTQAAERIANILEAACGSFPARIDLLAMTSHEVGGDDRMFNRQVADNFRNANSVRVERRYLPLDGLLCSLQSADAAVAMRYHGHLFCTALGIPFLSVDYTGGTGKVHRLIRRMEYQPWSEEWGKINVNRAAARLVALLKERTRWSAHLLQQADTLTADLEDTYNRVFHLTDRKPQQR
jgi:polysaccharide pyruvyl transferase WcaK-like protein